MKSFKILLTFFFVSILLLNFGLVLAIDSDEASVTVSWESPILYQGDVVPARITFVSNFSQPIEIYTVGINFGWMEPDNFQGRDLSATPVTVPSYGSHSFDVMVFQMPFDASIGQHEYFVGIDGSYDSLEGGSPIGFSWDSPIFILQIQDSAHKSYLDLNDQVSVKINQASELTYDSPEANDWILQALTSYNAANDYATNNQFPEAIASLQAASSYVDLADEEEQTFYQQQQDQNQVILFVILGIIAVAAIIIIFILVTKRKRPSEKLDKVNETET